MRPPRRRSFAPLFMLFIWLAGLCAPALANAQERVVFATVDRPPFAQETPEGFQGFTIDLVREIGTELGWTVEFRRYDRFDDMFEAISRGEADGAAANISITAAREQVLDFSQPIFAAGIGIMVPLDGGSASLWSALFSWDLALAILGAIILLFGGGMLMWAFERGKQAYFDRPAREAIFPAFWWALNLVVNGGFEERVPQSRPGRIFAVLLVISSLFIVSIFVARITAVMTVDAITGNITSLSDLEGRRVGTTIGSTASGFLDARGLVHEKAENLDILLRAFEAGELDAVVFDRPILAYYIQTEGAAIGRLLPGLFQAENYGIALPEQSPLREPINQTLLEIREDGRYDRLRARWFGAEG